MLLKILYKKTTERTAPHYPEDLDKTIGAYFRDIANIHPADASIGEYDNQLELRLDLKPKKIKHTIIRMGSAILDINSQFEEEACPSCEQRPGCKMISVQRDGKEVIYAIEFFDTPNIAEALEPVTEREALLSRNLH